MVTPHLHYVSPMLKKSSNALGGSGREVVLKSLFHRNKCMRDPDSKIFDVSLRFLGIILTEEKQQGGLMGKVVFSGCEWWARNSGLCEPPCRDLWDVLLRFP